MQSNSKTYILLMILMFLIRYIRVPRQFSFIIIKLSVYNVMPGSEANNASGQHTLVLYILRNTEVHKGSVQCSRDDGNNISGLSDGESSICSGN